MSEQGSLDQPSETMSATIEQSSLTPEQVAQKKAREKRLAAMIILLWVATGAALYLERDHWFGDFGAPKLNPAVLGRHSD